MTMYLSKSKRKRELATVARMGLEMIGILMSLLLMTFIVGDASQNCLPGSNTTTSIAEYYSTEAFSNMSYTYTSKIPSDTTSATNITDKPDKKAKSFYDSERYLVAGLILTALYVLSQIMLLFGVKEDPGKLYFLKIESLLLNN